MGLAILMALLLLLYVIGRKSAHAELVMEASPQQIWNVLMNEEDYGKWNHVLVPKEGEIEKGNSLTYHLINPNGTIIEFEFKVMELVPMRLLNQEGGFPGIFTFDHRYILEPDGKSTKVTIHEDFRGIASPFLNLGWIQEAYKGLNESLRDHVLESNAKNNDFQ